MRHALACLATALWLTACADQPGLEGKYAARGRDGAAVSLTLKAGYTGEWETSTDSVPLRWEIREGRLLLHSKNGGVLSGAIDGQRLVVTLPGEGELVFTRPGS